MKKIPTEVLRHHTAVVGKTGSGKTATEKLMIEQVVADGARVCVLDTTKSDWWGLTSNASGKSAGLPFTILGGPRGHVPLHSSAGKVIGNLVGTGKLPLSIVDMADFEPGGVQRFFCDFAQALFKGIRGVVYLVIEEAHEIAPKERAGFGSENMAIHWAKKLATASRTKGIKLIVATQRVQALHNAVLGSCETLIAHRVTMDADQEPILRWLKATDKTKVAEVGETLATLPTGTGWICSSEAKIFEKVAFPKFKTFDNTATPDHDTVEVDVKMAPVDQAALRDLIGDEVAKAEADDPKKLRDRIGVLERDNRRLEQERDSARSAQVDPKAVEEAERRGYERGVRDEAVASNKELAQFQNAWDHLAPALEAIGVKYRSLVDANENRVAIHLTNFKPSGLPAVKQTTVDSPRPAPPARLPSPAPAGGDGTLPVAARKMLTVLDTDPPVRRSWSQVATLAGLKARGGSYNTAKKALLESGLLDILGDLIAIASPSSSAGSGRKSPEELVTMWSNSLGGAAANILQLLFENGGEMTRTNIANILGVAARGGSWNTAWKELRDNNIVDVRGDFALLTELFHP